MCREVSLLLRHMHSSAFCRFQRQHVLVLAKRALRGCCQLCSGAWDVWGRGWVSWLTTQLPHGTPLPEPLQGAASFAAQNHHIFKERCHHPTEPHRGSGCVPTPELPCLGNSLAALWFHSQGSISALAQCWAVPPAALLPRGRAQHSQRRLRLALSLVLLWTLGTCALLKGTGRRWTLQTPHTLWLLLCCTSRPQSQAFEQIRRMWHKISAKYQAHQSVWTLQQM